jgi:WD40 repeat protein
MPLLEIPNLLVTCILDFLVPGDRLTLAATCRDLLEQVDSFSKREIDRIARRHRVDDTWNYRIGMQAGIDAAKRGGRGVSLSHRHLLHCASRTHLFSLGGGGSGSWRGCLSLACLPCGNFLLSGGYDGIVRLWDLTTKKCVRTFEGHTKYISSLHFVAGLVVSHAWEDETLRIWTLEGTCTHIISTGAVYHPMATVGQEVFFIAIGDHEDEAGTTFSTLDVLSGEVHILHAQHDECPCNRQLDVWGVLVSGNWVLFCTENNKEESRPGSGIYVFHRSSFTQESFLPGYFVGMEICDNGDVVAATLHGCIDVMHLNDGHLQSHFSFYVRFLAGLSYLEPNLLLVVGSSVYVKTTNRGENEIEVYDLCTGKRKRTMCYPIRDPFTGTDFFAGSLATNGRELFCGFHLGDFFDRSGSAIKAYLL